MPAIKLNFSDLLALQKEPILIALCLFCRLLNVMKNAPNLATMKDDQTMKVVLHFTKVCPGRKQGIYALARGYLKIRQPN